MQTSHFGAGQVELVSDDALDGNGMALKLAAKHGRAVAAVPDNVGCVKHQRPELLDPTHVHIRDCNGQVQVVVMNVSQQTGVGEAARRQTAGAG